MKNKAMGKGIRTRKVGETFLMDGKKYKVVEREDGGCQVCDLYKGILPCSGDMEVCGFCYKDFRTDNISVVFKEMKDEGR